MPELHVWQGKVQAREKEILAALSSILNPAASSELRVEKEAVDGGVAGEVNPETVNPMTELLKLPVILKELVVREMQVAAKSLNALHVRLVAVK